MFLRTNQFQYNAKPDKPDPVFAKKLQELIGGQWGEMSVMIGYLFQGWNCRGPAKYRDMILDIGTEEIGHVEMLATMVARLLEGATPEQQQGGAADPIVGAVMGGASVREALMSGMNPQHYIVSGLGAAPKDSVGVPWNASYVVASGNLMADFRFNLTAESQGRLQACRMYELTRDAGVRDMLSFLIARDTMHQNQWLAAIAELERDGVEATPVPMSFPRDRELGAVAYQYWNLSEGTESAQGAWARGPAPDGVGTFEYLANPAPLGETVVELPPVAPTTHNTPKAPAPPVAAD